MICKRCETSGQRGYVRLTHPAPPGLIYGFLRGWQPCPDCNGTGITSCCDGMENVHDDDRNPESQKQA